MKVYHGTSIKKALNIKTFGIIKNIDSLSIDNQGYFTFVNAFFCTPNKDVAYIYECDNNFKNEFKNEIGVIIKMKLSNTSKILDLTNAKNQNIVKKFLDTNKKNINDFLLQNYFDGCKQYVKNDYGKKRLEYAIVNIRKLQVINILTKRTKFGSLYLESTQENVNSDDYI